MSWRKVRWDELADMLKVWVIVAGLLVGLFAFGPFLWALKAWFDWWLGAI
jgi:hypothetical protein